jgi:hypothetical protein
MKFVSRKTFFLSEIISLKGFILREGGTDIKQVEC